MSVSGEGIYSSRTEMFGTCDQDNQQNVLSMIIEILKPQQ